MQTNKQNPEHLTKLKGKKLTFNETQSQQTPIFNIIIFDLKLNDNPRSNVYLGLIQNTKQLVAIKKIQKNTYSKKTFNDITITSNEQLKQKYQNQLNNLYKASQRYKINSNIVSVYPLLCYSSNKTHAYMIMQLCKNGTLQQEINVRQIRGQWFSFNQFYNIVRQFINGYQQVYLCSILHQNIRPENVLLSQHTVKIGNFSLSERIDVTQGQGQAHANIYYAAPQKYDTKYTPDSASDVYSLGIIFYQLIYNQHPYYPKQISKYRSQYNPLTLTSLLKTRNQTQKILQQILSTQLNTNIKPMIICKNQQQKQLLQKIIQIIHKMIQKTPKNRLSFKQLQLQFQKLPPIQTHNINFQNQKILPQKNYILQNYTKQQQSILQNLKLVTLSKYPLLQKQKITELYIIRQLSQRINILSNYLYSILFQLQKQIKQNNLYSQQIFNKIKNKLLFFTYKFTYIKYYQIQQYISKLNKQKQKQYKKSNIVYLVQNTKNNVKLLQDQLFQCKEDILKQYNIEQHNSNNKKDYIFQEKYLINDMKIFMQNNIKDNKLKILDQKNKIAYRFIILVMDYVEKIGEEFTIEEVQELREKQRILENNINSITLDDVRKRYQEYGVEFGLSQFFD